MARHCRGEWVSRDDDTRPDADESGGCALLTAFTVQVFTVGALAEAMVESRLAHTVVRSLLLVLSNALIEEEADESGLEPRARALRFDWRVPLAAAELPQGEHGAHFDAAADRATAVINGMRSAVLECGNKVVASRLLWRVLCDLRYLMRHESIALVIATDELLRPAWLRALSLMHGMHAAKRLVHAHREFEDKSWGEAFTLEVEMMAQSSSVRAGFLADAFTAGEMTERGVERARKLLSDLVGLLDEWMGGIQLRTKPSMTHPSIANLPEYDVSVRPVTFHIVLHRVFACFLHESIAKCNVSAAEVVRTSSAQSAEDFVVRLVEHPMRILMMVAQVRAGMWVRNGYMSIGQCTIYRNSYFAGYFFDMDVFLLQTAAVLLTPARFIALIAARWHLPVALLRLDHPVDVVPPSEGEVEHSRVLLEEWVKLVMVIAKERAMLGASVERTIRREVVHRLCIDELRHSQLVDSISRHFSEHPIMRTVLADVAIWEEPTGLKSGYYRLKPELWTEFDPYFPHFTQKELQVRP